MSIKTLIYRTLQCIVFPDIDIYSVCMCLTSLSMLSRSSLQSVYSGMVSDMLGCRFLREGPGCSSSRLDPAASSDCWDPWANLNKNTINQHADSRSVTRKTSYSKARFAQCIGEKYIYQGRIKRIRVLWLILQD